MSTKNAFYRRTFLNRPRHHLGAHVIADIALETPEAGRVWIDATVHLSDCSRHIDLDFSADTAREASNALRKIRVLQEVLADFEAALVLAQAEAGLDVPTRRG